LHVAFTDQKTLHSENFINMNNYTAQKVKQNQNFMAVQNVSKVKSQCIYKQCTTVSRPPPHLTV